MGKRKGVNWLERALLKVDKKAVKMTDGQLDIAILKAFPSSPIQKRLQENRDKRMR